MNTRKRYWKLAEHISSLTRNSSHRINCTGQALVEFTLVFLLLIVIAWIPADFGLAFYTGQLALNASREGARIAAAIPSPFNATATTDATNATCTRLSPALLLDPGSGFGT